jgi:predicted nucleic acid-binding protein
MRLVLDATVAIAAVRPNEAAHAAANTRVRRALRGDDQLLLPSVFIIEVTGALGRVGEPAARIRPYVESLISAPHELVTIGRANAKRIAALALASKLRGADASYVWLAARDGIPLVTLDEEILARGKGACQLLRP